MASLHNGPAVLVPFIRRCDEGVGNQLLAFPEDLLRSIRDAVKNSEDDDREKEEPANRVSKPAGVRAFFWCRWSRTWCTFWCSCGCGFVRTVSGHGECRSMTTDVHPPEVPLLSTLLHLR